jgi:fibro-slime domain-containing protein
VACGDGRIGGDEQCDDGDEDAEDGCGDRCQLEEGWACPYVGLPCVAAECGDGLVVGFEECDDGEAAAFDGCDDSCRIEEGFKCDVPGEPCETTTCGDAAAEGIEQCDDGNFDLGDGCTPFCKLEPDCSAGACVSACGDGIRLGTEVCDDGNTRSGDGCSSDCTEELGFDCVQPDLPPELEIPLVVRDFEGVDPIPATSGTPPDYDDPNHVDFELVDGDPDETSGTEDGEGGRDRIVRFGQGSSATGRGLDLGQPGETFPIRHVDGSVIATVSLSGKPVYDQSRTACDKTEFPAEANDWDKCTHTTMDADSFHTWYLDRDSTGNAVAWPNFLGRGETSLQTLTLLRGSFAAGGAFTAGGDAYTYDSRFMETDGTLGSSDGFYPVDSLGNTGTSCGGTDHNFHFTSEVRFWFEYDAAEQPSLDFSGDDDVWVYVNGHLALDIGGIHGRAAKNFTIDAGNATAWDLEDGNVYEIAVFQAERNQCASNYWLTLEGFNASKSECTSDCGDGIIASDELCDDGDDNHPTNPPPYGACGPDCKTRGPSCGDGNVDDSHEECDDGVNTSVYDFNGSGCAPGCVRPPFCGDGEIQSSQEECDDGENDGSYGTCTPECELAPRCGDRVVQMPREQCDDGPSGSSNCSPQCEDLDPR